MKRVRNFLKEEKAAAQMIEAAIIYPTVFMCIFFLIYIGLYILQAMTVNAYAQKVAFLAAREIAYPGYIDLVSKDKYTSSAVEADVDTFKGEVKLSFDPSTVQSRAYRYWSSDPIAKYKGSFEEILRDMIRKNSVIGAKENVEANVDSSNYFVVQYVTVSVSQPLMDFAVLEYFGIESPTVKATVKASANDTDEFVRNTDFAVDAIEAIANKLGLDVNSLKEKVQNAKTTLGLD